MGRKFPLLTQADMVRLDKLRCSSPNAFYSNQTKYLLKEMRSYIEDARVFRLSIMGEVRSGKSECGQTLALLYIKTFNDLLKSGYFDHLDVWKFFKKIPITFDVEYIMGNQIEYINELRTMQREGKLKFGQVWVIDESKDISGGIGTFSEKIDLNNVNNIIAKFMQSEIWITPQKFESRNAPYGLYVFKKDLKEKANWCLLYKIEITARCTRDYHFLGWVKIPLHPDEVLRENYNDKKNKWISEEIQGGADARMRARKEVSAMLSEDPVFCSMTPSGKQFILNKEQQLAMLENMIIDQRTQNWNEMERWRIVEEARMISLQREINKRLADPEIKSNGDEE